MPVGEVIVAPDVLAAVLAHLRTVIPTTHTSAVIPKDLQSRSSAVVAQLSGGGERDLVVFQPSITFDCYASTNKAAADLARLVQAHITSLRGAVVEGVTFYEIQPFAGPAYLPDPVSEKPMYRQTISIGARGTAI